MSLLRAVLLVALAGAVTARAEEPGVPDPKSWPCRFCQGDDGATGWVEPGLWSVADPSFRFGDYRGLEDRGWAADLAAAWRYRAEGTGDAWDATVERLGLDSRALALRGGRQGSYRVSLDYSTLPHRVAGDTRSPFTGIAQLGLPGNWTTAGSTAGMAALDSSLHPAWLRQEREHSALGLAWLPRRDLDVRFDYQRQALRGTGATGGSFVTLASQLPRPVHQALDRAAASVGFGHALGHGQLALSSSFFRNDVDALGWQNPYNAPAPGADRGQLAMAPDNRSDRADLTLALPRAWPLQVSAQLGLGQLRQDEAFLPATVNPNEAVAVPRPSLDARVDTSLAFVKASATPWRALRVTADLLREERDNRTAVAAYPQVVMDTFAGGVRSNAPYGSSRDRWRLAVERRSGLRLAAGVAEDVRERRLHGTAETRERTYWSRAGWRSSGMGDVRVRLLHAEREGSEYAADPGAGPQNPLLRMASTADRRRDELRADLGFTLARVTSSFNLAYQREVYPASTLGRTEAGDFSYGMDIALEPIAGVSATAFLSQRQQDIEQAGSQAFAQPDWFAQQEDATTVAGVHLEWQGPRGLEAGADYVHAGAKGDLLITAGGAGEAFPQRVTDWHEFRLFAAYAWRPNVALRLDLEREVYDAEDWAVDGVGPDTVPNVLALGQQTPAGNVSAVLISARYRFGGETRAAP